MGRVGRFGVEPDSEVEGPFQAFLTNLRERVPLSHDVGPRAEDLQGEGGGHAGGRCRRPLRSLP